MEVVKATQDKLAMIEAVLAEKDLSENSKGTLKRTWDEYQTQTQGQVEELLSRKRSRVGEMSEFLTTQNVLNSIFSFPPSRETLEEWRGRHRGKRGGMGPTWTNPQKVKTSSKEAPTPKEGPSSSEERIQEQRERAKEPRKRQGPIVTQLPVFPPVECTLYTNCTCIKCCCNINFSPCDLNSIFSLRALGITNGNPEFLVNLSDYIGNLGMTLVRLIVTL